MVAKSILKLGFIAEGETEKIILEKTNFFKLLKSKKIEFVSDVIDAGGCCNLLPHNLEAFVLALQKKGATKIIILTDLDTDKCITLTKERIIAEQQNFNHVISVSVKEIESWLLADTEAMRSYMCDADFYYETPELVDDPYEEIKRLKISGCGRGTGTKLAMANQLIENHGFSIENAASHTNCNSAKYFLKCVLGN